jgi:hypothetical protein
MPPSINLIIEEFSLFQKIPSKVYIDKISSPVLSSPNFILDAKKSLSFVILKKLENPYNYNEHPFHLSLLKLKKN